MESPDQPRPQPRPRSKSGFSFRSDKSGGGGGGSSVKSGGIKRESLHETHEEKRKNHLSITGKANPNAAMTELQPVAAALEKPTLGSLRSMSYNDQYGNLITEPDRSNPTRPRWERPLDTIRSFEAAIDNEYKQRQALRSEVGTEAGYGGYASRRSSTYWGGGYDQARPRYSAAGSTVGSYYGGPNRDSYADNGYGPPHTPASMPRQRYNPRLQSDPTLARYANQNGGPYTGSGLQQSRDTVDSGTASGSGSEQWANSTDPSSENSSIDRVKGSPAKMGDYEPQHGYPDYPSYGNPQFRGPIMEEGGYGQNSYGTWHSAGNVNSYFGQNPSDGLPPAPPPKTDAQRRITSLNRGQNAPYANGSYQNGTYQNGTYQKGTPLQASSGNVGSPSLQSQPSQKRKSWLRRKLGSKE